MSWPPRLALLLRITDTRGIARRYLVVNGFAPLLVSVIIISPLVLASLGVFEYLPSMRGAIALALLTVFLFGVFLGRIDRTFWLISGLQALIIALCTLGHIVLLGG